MNADQIIEKTLTYVKKELEGAEGGHDWWHINRVWKNSLKIAETEKADLLIVQLGALLHDIADAKFHDGDEEIGPRKAKHFLEDLKLPTSTIEHVVSIIENISFKGGNFKQGFRSTELDIVQDADRLDALGAVGIARTFNYGGYKNNPIYDPYVEPKLDMTKEEYKKSNAPTINHFYEKLLLLKDRMNTEKGKSMAQSRHNYMKDFLQQFYSEWNGEK